MRLDRETGDIRLLGLVAAQNVGTAITPMGTEGQVQGGAAVGPGYALSRCIIYDGSRVLNDSLMDYRMPASVDVPAVEPHIVEQPDTGGSFGAKSSGELPYVPVAGGIANAV